MDRNGNPCEGITGAYYTQVQQALNFFRTFKNIFKEMLRPFKEWLDRKMKERYPDPDERSNEYKKMYFEQGSAHSRSNNVLFNLIILIETFKA